MSTIRLIHWKAAETGERVARLRAAGYDVNADPFDPSDLRRLKADPPSAVVIDLTRLPSHGRDVGVALRAAKATRHVPLVFVEGEPEKVARVRHDLPDAVFTTWSRIRSSLRRAIVHPPKHPVVPASRLAGYSGTPLPRKLGIGPDTSVILVGAPEGFERMLGRLPGGVRLRRQARGRGERVLWFPRSKEDLDSRLNRVAGLLAEKGGLWIAWPKKASGVETDLSQTVVRGTGLAAGLVDYKICALDETWSALLFARRKPEANRARRR